MSNRAIRVSAALALGLAAVALAGPLTASAAARPATQLTALPASSQPTTDQVTGTYRSPRMSIEVALAPRNAGALNATLAGLYNPRSSVYQHWLAKGQFDARFAPSQAARAAVTGYLASKGLTVQPSASVFLIRATGSSERVTTAFGTTLRTYRDPAGSRYFGNASAVRMPSLLAPDVLGVIGLSDTVRMRSAAKPVSCQLPYPTLAFFTQEVEAGVPDTEVPRGYGGGPGCSGLTPTQGNSIYGAPEVGPRAKGAGVTLALFEQSAYQPSDIATWAHRFYGPRYTPPISAINVDGGPVSPACPAGDACVPSSEAYYYDVEPVADIDTMLMISPDARSIEVYDAPNDELGITTLDEYTQIANDDTASVVSSSWGICENDAGAGYALAQNTIFQQMAAQGQSMFAATGDTGPFGCIRNDGTVGLNAWNPASQPWVTAVGGTSFGNFNPGSDPYPFYPYGTESVWNTDSLCNASAAEGPLPGYDWCALTGAGGGGSSQFFGRPSYQAGPGVTNANATTGCTLAAAGTPCREVPDVSADADPFTGFAEYCTGNASTPDSYCATFSGIRNDPGWFGDGGTSVATPLWAAIIADRDGFLRTRTGNANPLLYHLFDTEPHRYFHDITGAGQAVTSNGLFPVTPGYDEATGIGTPKMAQLITGSF